MSLEQYGWQQPIVTDSENVVIAGHTRLLAAQRLEMKTVPVVIASDLTPEQVKAYRIADNRLAREAVWNEDLLRTELNELADSNFDLLFTGFDTHELMRLCDAVDIQTGKTDANEEWTGMPEYSSSDETSFKRLIIHFKNQQDVDDFAKLIKQTLAEKTMSIWIPEVASLKVADKCYE